MVTQNHINVQFGHIKRVFGRGWLFSYFVLTVVQLKPVLSERHKMEFWLHTVLVLAVSAVTVLGRPDGAPIDACSNGLVPGHPSPPNMANGSVPFYVNISNFGGYYMPEETYTIVLSGNATANNTDFRGFIIQARTMADDSPVGQFMTGNSTDQKLLCTGNTAVTHTSPAEKTMVGLYWTAPMAGQGTIVFRYAFVDRYSMGNINIFWAGLETDTIGEAGAPTPTVTTVTAIPVTVVTVGVTTVTTVTASTPTATPTTTPTTTPPGGGSSGLVAGTMLIVLLSTIITLIN